jgi:GTP-binding protein Era
MTAEAEDHSEEARFEEETLDLDSLAEEATPAGHRSGFVAVIGRPNVGKSTLMNAFLQQKVAIVTHRPQTTRTRQLGIVTTPDYQIVFVDTPGIMHPRHKLDEFMLETAVETLQDADLALWLTDGSFPPGEEDREIAERLRPLTASRPVLLAINKADLIQPDQVLPRAESYRALLPEAANWLLFSAKQGRGVEELLQMIVAALPEGPRYYPMDQVTDVYMRDIAAELVREQILLQLHEEVPHGVAVVVDEFKERENDVTYISATVYVERNSHKQIVIGGGGSQLRQIGAAARQQIEEMLGSKVFLELWVKVEPKWRHDETALRRLGYSRPRT